MVLSELRIAKTCWLVGDGWKRGGSLGKVEASAVVSGNQKRVLASGRFEPVVGQELRVADKERRCHKRKRCRKDVVALGSLARLTFVLLRSAK